MKVLVTGSEGFIGRNLVKRLEGDGHEVIGYDVKNNDPDFRDCADFDWSKEHFDVVYHLACMNQMEAESEPFHNLSVNAFRTKIMAYFAKRVGAKLIYTSTASVYGQQSMLPIKRTCFPRPMSDYAVAKLAGEYFVTNSGCESTILRLSNVYGPYQTTDNPYCGVIGRFIEDALLGKPLTVIGDGTQSRDFTYVDDVVSVLTDLLVVKRPGIFNLSRGEDVSINQLVTTLRVILGRPIEFDVDAPVRPVDGIRHRVLASDFPCGTRLEDGLRETVAWYQDHLQLTVPNLHSEV